MSLHVECARIRRLPDGTAAAPIENAELVWSETEATAGTTTQEAPSGRDVVLTLTATVDMWVSIGAAPNAAADPRRRLQANARVSFAANPGDKVAWATV